MVFYYKYYLEIRNRLSLILTSWVCVSTTCYFYKEILLFLLIDSNYNFLSTDQIDCYFIFTNISELFSVYLNLIFFISNQTTLFFLIYHFILFISYGLYRIEYNNLIVIFRTVSLSWLLSICLFDVFVLPASTKFFLSFQQTESVSLFFEAKIAEYFDYFTSLYHICLISCQLLTLILFVLISFDYSLTKIKKFRKLFYLIFLVFATLITPPDIISQIMVGGSLTVLYELTLILIIINKVTN